LDQGLFATSNFAVSVLLARWLSANGYGAFSVGFAIFILVGVVHTAILSEPMLVFGSGKYKDRLPDYLSTLVYGHLGFAALGSLVLAITSAGFALFGSGSLSGVLLALAITEPFILFLWLMRRACYARLEPHLAASGGAIYMLLMLGGAYVLYERGWLSAESVFGVMGISSLVVGLWLAMRLGLKRMPLRGNDLARGSLENHWAYGRWSIANEALNWVPMNIYYLMLPLWGGLAAGAYLKALMNLIMPMSQAIWALSILLLPVLVRARGEDRAGTGHARFNSRVRLALIPFVLGPFLYWLLLGLFNYPLVSWLYDGRYTEHAALLWILGLSPVVASVKQVMGQSLRALERPDRLFWAYMLSATVTLTFGTGLVWIWGVVGAAIGFLVSQGITAALALVLLRRLESSQRQATMEPPTSASALATRAPEARKT
jgi:O-antigen/teichoic acid export membrane protein